MARAGCVQPPRSRHDVRRGVAGGMMIADKLLLAEPEQLDAALDRGSQRRSRQVGNDYLPVGAQIAAQATV